MGKTRVVIFADSFCGSKPGRGGYGVLLSSGPATKELSGGFALTTNRRMELFAVLHGLEALKFPCTVSLHSSSKYVIDGISLLGDGAMKLGGRKNSELWSRLRRLMKKHQIEAQLVSDAEALPGYERCAVLAKEAAKAENLPPDPGYVAKEVAADGTSPSHSRKGIRITQVGQPCRKCGTPVVKQIPRDSDSTNKAYTYAYYFWCPNCRAMYMVEAAKVFPTPPADSP